MPSLPSEGMEKKEALGGEAGLRLDCVPVATQPANQPRREVVTKDDRWFLWSSGNTEEEGTSERVSHKFTHADRKPSGIWKRSQREGRDRNKGGVGVDSLGNCKGSAKKLVPKYRKVQSWAQECGHINI